MRIRYILYNPAVIVIQFPNGDVWEYIIYCNRTLKKLLKLKRNMGRLIAKLKKFKSCKIS